MHYWDTFVVIVLRPFQQTDLIWGIVPLYFGWLLNEMTSSKASFRTAIQTGFTFIWAAAQWLFQNTRRLKLPEISFDALMAANMFVTLLVLAVGVLALVSGLRKKFPKYCKFLGHSRFAAYFLVMMFPMQSGALEWSWDRLVAIVLFALPAWLLVHVGLMPVRK